MVWLLNVKLGAEQSTYLAKLEIENWSAAYRAHCRSTPCALPAAYHAHGSASYHAHPAAHSAHCAAYRAHLSQYIVRTSAGTLRLRT